MQSPIFLLDKEEWGCLRRPQFTVNGLAGSIFEVLWDEGFLKGVTECLEDLFGVQDLWIYQLYVPSFSEGDSTSCTHFVKEDQNDHLVILVDVVVDSEVGFHSQ